jgi:hypothetical protein
MVTPFAESTVSAGGPDRPDGSDDAASLCRDNLLLGAALLVAL